MLESTYTPEDVERAREEDIQRIADDIWNCPTPQGAATLVKALIATERARGREERELPTQDDEIRLAQLYEQMDEAQKSPRLDPWLCNEYIIFLRKMQVAAERAGRAKGLEEAARIADRWASDKGVGLGHSCVGYCQGIARGIRSLIEKEQ